MIVFIPIELRSARAATGFPLANLLLITANVAVFLASPLLGWNWVVGTNSGIFSILMYGFSHAGMWHLVLNMWALWVFGNPVNRRLGNAWYTAAYLGTIVALGLCARMTFQGEILGASGGIFAVITIAAMLLPSARLRVGYGVLFPLTLLFGLFRKPRHEFEWIVRGGGVEVPCVWCLVLIPMIQVITLLVSVWFLQNAAGNVGHLLGMLCGLAIVLLLPKRISMRQPQFAGIL